MVDAPGLSHAQLTAQNKKRRNPNACDLCRKKKIRCDSAVMPGNRCSECISYNCQCVHSGGKKYVSYYRAPTILPKAPSSPEQSSGTSSSGVSGSRGSSVETPPLHPLVSAAISLLPTGLNSSASSALAHISSHIINLERHVSELKAATASNSSFFVQPDHTTPEYEEGEEEDANEDQAVVQLAEQLTDLHLKPGEAGRHFGPSSTMSLVGMALKVLMDSNKDPDIITNFRGIRRPFYWGILPWESGLHEDLPIHDFPPPALMAELIDLYFREINMLLPLLHKPTFMKLLLQNEHILNPHFGETVLGVCAVAARWSPDPAVLLEGDDMGHSAGWRWFRQIRLFTKLTAPRIPSVYELQSNILAVLYLGGSSQPGVAWMLLGLGIRYAIEVGAHRKRADPSVDSELWKRAFWVIWCYEGLLASFLGRPRPSMADEFDVDLPTDCDDEYWETGEPETDFKQPPGKPSSLSAFVAWIKLVHILDYAQAQLFSVKATKAIASGRHKAQDAVAHLDSELNRWRDTLPDHLRWENYQHVDSSEKIQSLGLVGSNFFKQAALLQCTYHQLHILAHRPFIFFSKPDSPMFISSWAICTSSARACIKILSVWQPFMSVHFTILAAAIITLLEKWKVGKRNTQGPNPGRESVLECLRIVRQFEDRWVGAGKMADVLSELIYLDDLVSRSSASPGPSSPESQQGSTKIKPEDIFRMATNSFPTFDLNFYGRGLPGEEEEFAMLF